MLNRILARAFCTSANGFTGGKANPMVDLYSGPSSFELFSSLSKAMNSFDFGHGAPDSPPPKFLRQALADVIESNSEYHQYARCQGSLEFAEVISKEYSPSFGRKIDPENEICATAGATQAITNALYSFVDPHDEIVCFEPSFLGYTPLFRIIGPKIRWVNFRENKAERKFELDRDAFVASITDKTKILFLNNPQNPLGKLFSEEDLVFIAEQVRKHPKLIVISDEVYDKFVFNSRKFTRFATLPGMWERTISIYSSGKVFNCTGWRVGFSIAPKEFTIPMGSFQEWSVACMNHLSEIAVMKGMEIAQNEPFEGKSNYYEWLRTSFEWRAKKMTQIMHSSNLGIKMYEPEGGYFTVGNIEDTIKRVPIKYFYKDQAKGGEKTLSHFEDWKSLDSPDFTPDSACCLYFTKELGFTTVPVSAFFDNLPDSKVTERRGTNFVRFALCKQDEFVTNWEKDLIKRGVIQN